jgi:hypothetical protein
MDLIKDWVICLLALFFFFGVTLLITAEFGVHVGAALFCGYLLLHDQFGIERELGMLFTFFA